MQPNQTLFYSSILIPRYIRPAIIRSNVVRASELKSLMVLNENISVSLKLNLLDGVPVLCDRFNAGQALDFFLNEVDGNELFRITKNTLYSFKVTALNGYSVMSNFNVTRLSIKAQYIPTKMKPYSR